MNRAFLIVEKMYGEGVLNNSDGRNSLLIVGAGAAGATAGIRAAQRGARVRIIEKENAPFFLQRDSAGRWIDPALYDWPLGHWDQSQFPIEPGCDMPIAWVGANASAIVVDWTDTLNEAVATWRGRFEVRYSTTFERLSSCGSARSTKTIGAVMSSPSHPAETECFNSVLFCHGFGRERTTLGRYTGPLFWSPLIASPLWLSSSKVLVSGSGDGALQDFLLAATTANSARDLFEALFPTSWRCRLREQIQDAEDQAQRAMLWAGGNHHDILVALESVHRRMVDEVFDKYPPIRSSIDAVTHPGREVRICHPCNHFGPAYPLNRFLALLLIARAKESETEVRYESVATSKVVSSKEGDHPQCDPAIPELCIGHRHTASFVPRDCRNNPVEAHVPPNEDFDCIILRHGVERPKPVRSLLNSRAEKLLKAPGIDRQLLPYWIS